MKKIILLLFLNSFVLGMAQVGVNSDASNPDASAMLDVKSTAKGLLIPRMSVSDRDNIASPATGLIVYVTDDNSFYYYDGTTWVQMQNSGKSWLLNGNAGTTGAEFLGTTDAQPLIFKTNNLERMRIKDNGVVGINTTPDDNVQLTVSANDKGVIGEFVGTRANNNDIGVYGDVTTTDSYGLGGLFIGGYIGVYGEVLPAGSDNYYGVVGVVSGGTGINYGLISSVNGDGVNFGTYNFVNDGAQAALATNFGTYNSLTGDGTNVGFITSITGTGTNYGYYGNFSAPNGNGAIGFLSNTADDGIALIANGSNVSSYYTSPNGAGISATGSLLAIGGYTDLDDDNAVGVEGRYQGTTDTDATGILGYSAPANYYGYGVKGIGGWIGVYGETDSNGFAAIYANGDIDASGTKSFVIDHPQDPENKFLKHFSIESNEVLNVYRGVVRLNANGVAHITMPSYFMVINKNFSYQLTPIGNAAPSLYIAKEINERGVFKIAGGQPGQKIAWVVYAERNDPYLQQHPEKRQVEVLKKDKEKGKYLMPELYNQPDSKALIPISSYKKGKVKRMKVSQTKVVSPEKQDPKFFKAKKLIDKIKAKKK